MTIRECFILYGHCACNTVRYYLDAPPLIVHCCHCSWCQRETGAAFAVNAVIENHHLHLAHGTITQILVPSASGRGQRIARCPRCHIALWSHYRHPGLSFVRIGTLEYPGACPPDVHIYTADKQPWVILPPDIPAYPAFYPDPAVVLSPGGLQRYLAIAGIEG